MLKNQTRILIYATQADTARQTLPFVHVVRVIELCCFNSIPDPYNGQTANLISILLIHISRIATRTSVVFRGSIAELRELGVSEIPMSAIFEKKS